MLRIVKYELILIWTWFLKKLPGKLGCVIRRAALPVKGVGPFFIWDNVQIDYPSRLVVGKGTSINRGCILNCAGGIVIEDGVLVGPNVTIYSQNHAYKNKGIKINEQGYEYKSVLVQSGAWIASNAVVLPGVIIGEGAVVGAGSVVTKNVEPFSICVGNPARCIGYRS